jgi:hypothetical protein
MRGVQGWLANNDEAKLDKVANSRFFSYLSGWKSYTADTKLEKVYDAGDVAHGRTLDPGAVDAEGPTVIESDRSTAGPRGNIHAGPKTSSRQHDRSRPLGWYSSIVPNMVEAADFTEKSRSSVVSSAFGNAIVTTTADRRQIT